MPGAGLPAIVISLKPLSNGLSTQLLCALLHAGIGG